MPLGYFGLGFFLGSTGYLFGLRHATRKKNPGAGFFRGSKGFFLGSDQHGFFSGSGGFFLGCEALA